MVFLCTVSACARYPLLDHAILLYYICFHLSPLKDVLENDKNILCLVSMSVDLGDRF